jgi:predicted pyridoxine 5'-phosphate oxidase superfamily flavin-nucleotide-binding protein
VGKTYQSISAEHRAFIERQPMFFVASAPLSPGGHVNLSPKGLDALRVIDPTAVSYLDLTGSGNETAAHLVENGRVTLMFCAFEGSPKILRLYCRGRVVTRVSADWAEAIALYPEQPGVRQVIVCTVEMVQTSCGFGVPRMNLVEQRDQLPRWAESKGEDGLVEYRRTRNAVSIDGLLAPPMD